MSKKVVKGKFETDKRHKRGDLRQKIGKMCVWDGIMEYNQTFTCGVSMIA